MSYAGFTPDVRAQLRGLADGNQAPFTLLLACRTPLDQLFPDKPGQSSPLANICPGKQLPNFSQIETKQFLQQRLSQTMLTFTTIEQGTLYRETQGHPGQLQQQAYQLFQQYVQFDI